MSVHRLSGYVWSHVLAGGGGLASMVPGPFCGVGMSRGGYSPPGVGMSGVGYILGVGTHPLPHPWIHGILRDMVYIQAIHILLKCFLVKNFSSKNYYVCVK